MSIIMFWIQVHNLLPNHMIAKNAPIISRQVGKVLKFEESIYKGVLIHSFFHIRILVLLFVPLKLKF